MSLLLSNCIICVMSLIVGFLACRLIFTPHAKVWIEVSRGRVTKQGPVDVEIVKDSA